MDRGTSLLSPELQSKAIQRRKARANPGKLGKARVNPGKLGKARVNPGKLVEFYFYLFDVKARAPVDQHDSPGYLSRVLKVPAPEVPGAGRGRCHKHVHTAGRQACFGPLYVVCCYGRGMSNVALQVIKHGRCAKHRRQRMTRGTDIQQSHVD